MENVNIYSEVPFPVYEFAEMVGGFSDPLFYDFLKFFFIIFFFIFCIKIFGILFDSSSR